MAVSHSTAQIDRVTVSVDIDLDAFPPDANSVRASVMYTVPDDPNAHRMAYAMRVEVEWGNVCSHCQQLEVYTTDWIVEFDNLVECATYFGAVCDHFEHIDNCQFGFESEVQK